MYTLSRRLALSVSAPLLLFFIITSLVLDANFRDLTRQSLQSLLEAQMVALIGAAEVQDNGLVAPPAHTMNTRYVTPHSGLYAQIRIAGSEATWRSPSLAGSEADFGPDLAPGEERQQYVTLPDGEPVLLSMRGINFADDSARSPDRNTTFAVAMSTRPADDQLWRFRRELLGWFVALTLLLFATLGALLRWVMKPMRRLEREITAVEEGRRASVEGEYPRELNGVVTNLNALLSAERRRVVRYRETLGNLAHSLKTPLAVMRAAIAPVSDQPDAARTVHGQIDRMSAIIEHQLKRAATSGGATVGQSATAVAPIVAELRAALLRVYASKDLMIETSVPEGLLFVGDVGDLTELLGNLLDNACKWCRTHVRLTASVDGGLHIAVEDDGPGIPAADRDKVLGRGVRADERVPGHGLGLAMSRDTVEAYGGTIGVGSSPLGGALVRVQFPGRAQLAAPESAALTS